MVNDKNQIEPKSRLQKYELCFLIDIDQIVTIN